MLCPVCKDSKLTMMERAGIEIDYCPDCRGVWLDRGELDKIIERSASEPAGDVESDHGSRKPSGKRKKREGLLGELLDF